MYEENNIYTNSQKNVAKSNSSKSLHANTYYYKLDKDSVFLDHPHQYFLVLKACRQQRTLVVSHVLHDKIDKIGGYQNTKSESNQYQHCKPAMLTIHRKGFKDFVSASTRLLKVELSNTVFNLKVICIN